MKPLRTASMRGEHPQVQPVGSWLDPLCNHSGVEESDLAMSRWTLHWLPEGPAGRLGFARTVIWGRSQGGLIP